MQNIITYNKMLALSAVVFATAIWLYELDYRTSLAQCQVTHSFATCVAGLR